MSKKAYIMLWPAALLIAASLSQPRFVRAEVEWTITKQLDLPASPLDIATSTDGRWIYILTPGEVLIHSVLEDRVVNRIPIERTFDKLTYSPNDNSLILTSQSEKSLKIVRLEVIHEFSVVGLPFLGPEHAPVIIAVFSEYQ